MGISLPGFGIVKTSGEGARFENRVKKGNHPFSQGGTGKNPVVSKANYQGAGKKLDVQIKKEVK